MTIEAVIGANYGDEGKGLFTEYLCRNRPKPLVVLSNGGSQRGHTVYNTEKNFRHVYHHFGSGTSLGVPSVFASTFLLNPIRYVEEKSELHKHGIHPTCFRAPSCLLQLPSDMFINQMIEKARAVHGTKHGSCGWGIWETQVRNKEYKQLTFEDFASMDYDAKRSYLIEAADWQAYTRMEGIYDKLVDWETFDLIESDAFIKHFIQDFEEMRRTCKVLNSDKILEEDYGFNPSTFIVENGQGLLLDVDYAPENSIAHSTPSKTGMAGVVAALGLTKPTDLPMFSNYITRSYFYKNDAGPFPEETPQMSFSDETNKPNDWQDTIRFGKMSEEDVVKLCDRKDKDYLSQAKFFKQTLALVVATHLNEVRNTPLEEIAAYHSYVDDSRQVL